MVLVAAITLFGMEGNVLRAVMSSGGGISSRTARWCFKRKALLDISYCSSLGVSDE